MPTFKEQQERLYRLRHQLAVWTYIYSHLDEDYVPKDHSDPAKALRVDNAVPEVVPEEIYEVILQELGDKYISKIKQEIEDLENMEVLILDKDDPGVKGVSN